MFAIRIIRLHPAHNRRKHQCFSFLLPPLQHYSTSYIVWSKDMNHWVNLTTHPRILMCMSQWAQASKNKAPLNQEQVSAHLSTLHSIWIRFGAMSVDDAVLPGIAKRITRHPPSRKYLPPEDGDEAKGRCHRGEIRVVGWLAHKGKLCQTGGWTLFGHESPRATCCIVSWVFLQLRTESFIFYVP